MFFFTKTPNLSFHKFKNVNSPLTQKLPWQQRETKERRSIHTSFKKTAIFDADDIRTDRIKFNKIYRQLYKILMYFSF